MSGEEVAGVIGIVFFSSIYWILHLVATFVAIYLSVKRHGGFHFPSMLVAVFCPWIYIIYALITTKHHCGKEKYKDLDYCTGKKKNGKSSGSSNNLPGNSTQSII